MKSVKNLAVAFGLVGAALVGQPSPPVAIAADAPTTKPLGDLSSFITIAKDAQMIAKGGDFAKARARVKDLEKAWDDAEDQYRPNNPDGWRDTDRKLDKTLDKLRDMKPDQAVVNGALDTLVTTLEGLHKAK